jgi:hypothetical protein
MYVYVHSADVPGSLDGIERSPDAPPFTCGLAGELRELIGGNTSVVTERPASSVDCRQPPVR